MIALPYINAYIIWSYDAIILLFCTCKNDINYGTITPYMLKFLLFYSNL